MRSLPSECQPSQARVSVLDAGMSASANAASHPKCSAAASGATVWSSLPRDLDREKPVRTGRPYPGPRVVDGRAWFRWFREPYVHV
jgi:hypothetical protein